MATTEQTAYGPMIVTWGVTSPESELMSKGIDMEDEQLEGSPSFLTCLDPIYGERKVLGIYLDRQGSPYVLGEITNGVYAIGVLQNR